MCEEAYALSENITFAIRLRFKKENEARFLSHLDLNRIFSRALRRTGLPIWYTEGFNPHPYLYFGPPLSLGFWGLREILDVTLIENVAPVKVKEVLKELLPVGLSVSEVYEKEQKISKIAFSSYDISFTEKKTDAELIRDYLSRGEIIVKKTTKRGERDVNITGLIKSWDIKGSDGCLLQLKAVSDGQNNLNPMLLVSAMKRDAIIEEDARANITRTDFYDIAENIFI